MPSTAKLKDLRSVSDLAARAEARTPSRGATTALSVEPVTRRLPRNRLRLFWLLDSLPARALRRLLGRSLGRLFEVAIYVALASGLGLFSAWYAIDYGSRFTVERDGPWRRWTLAGSPDADPYTRAHFAGIGWLPLGPQAATYFATNRESSGDPLYSDCEYTLKGLPPKAGRWTLSAYDLNGALIDAGAGPSAVDSDTALLGAGGIVTMTLSQSASPGNWLSLSGATRMQLVLTVYGLPQKAAAAPGAQPSGLFKIDRTSCQ